MLLGTLTAALVAAPLGALAGSAHPQLYLSPSPPRLHHSLVLDAPQTNAVLASHLGVSHHLPLPTAKGAQGRAWEVALDDSPLARSPDHARIVVILECPKSGCDDALPLDVLSAASPPLSLPALPSHSYLAALSLHLHRLADSLGLDPESQNPAIQGLQDLVDQGIKTVAGWQGWVGDELARWIGYHGDNSARVNKVRPAVEPPARGSGIVDDLDLLADEVRSPRSLARFPPRRLTPPRPSLAVLEAARPRARQGCCPRRRRLFLVVALWRLRLGPAGARRRAKGRRHSPQGAQGACAPLSSLLCPGSFAIPRH